MKKRLLSMLLALSMLIGMVPTSVLAAETGPIVATADGKPVEVSVVEDATDQYGGPVYYVAYPMGSDLVVSLNDGISNAVVMQDSGYYWSSYNDADPGAEKATLPYDILLEIGLPFDSFGTDCGHYANIGTGNLGLQLEVLGIVVYEDGGMEARAAYTLVVEAVHECYDDDDDGCCDDCGEELVAAEPTYKITDKSGYLYADVSNAKVGETVTITVKAPDGEVLTSLSVTTNGENVAYEKTEDGTYTFTMPAADVELDGTFAAAVPVRAMILDDDEIGEATVTLNGVVVTPDDSVMAAPGETVYVTVEPTKGWVVNGAKGTYYAMSGGSISPQNIVVGDNLDGTFAVTIPEDAINMFGMGFDINIDLVPAPAEYAVNIAETTGGTVSVGKMVNSELVSIETAPANQTVVVTATPNEGYELDAITVTAADGESVRVTGTTFAMPGKDVTVTVTFKRSFTGYTITVVESENGKVEASKTSAEADEDIFLTVTPDAGYKLDTLSVTCGRGLFRVLYRGRL